MTLERAVRGRSDKLMWPLMEGGLPRTADISPDLTPLHLLFLSPTPSPSHGLNCHHFPAYLVHIIIIIIIFVQGYLKKELSYKCCKDSPNRDWVYMQLHFYPKPLMASLTAYFIFRYISIHPTPQQTSVKLFYCGFHGYFEAQRVKPAQKVKKTTTYNSSIIRLCFRKGRIAPLRIPSRSPNTLSTFKSHLFIHI